MKKICLAVFFAVMLGWAFQPAVHAQSSNPQETLKQYISDLQKNPNDYALREKIIKLVQEMKPAPAIPEEARRYFVEGNTLFKAAKTQKGYGLAIDAYRQCLLIAPWWAEALYNYAVALDLASQFDEAMNTLKLYIATNLGETESRKAQDKIYEIGARKKLAAQEREESSPQAVAAREQNKFDDWLRKLDGRRYTLRGSNVIMTIDVRNKFFVKGRIINGEYSEDGDHVEIRGRETTSPFVDNCAHNIDQQGYLYGPCITAHGEQTFIISEDDGKITWRWWKSNGESNPGWIYLWQR